MSDPDPDDACLRALDEVLRLIDAVEPAAPAPRKRRWFAAAPRTDELIYEGCLIGLAALRASVERMIRDRRDNPWPDGDDDQARRAVMARVMMSAASLARQFASRANQVGNAGGPLGGALQYEGAARILVSLRIPLRRMFHGEEADGVIAGLPRPCDLHLRASKAPRRASAPAPV